MSISEGVFHNLEEMSQRKGRKRKLEKELDEIVHQDRKNVLDTGESPSEAMSLVTAAEDIASSKIGPRSLEREILNSDHPEDKSKTAKGMLVYSYTERCISPD